MKTVDNHPVLGPPKSKSGVRTIPIPENARASAKYLREHGGKTLIWSLPGRNPCYSVRAFRRRYYTAIGQVEGVRKLSPTATVTRISPGYKPRVCVQLPSDSPSPRTPLLFGYALPTTGRARDFHPLDSAHAGRTKSNTPGQQPICCHPGVFFPP